MENPLEIVIRFTRLRDEFQPVQVFPPISVDWVAITHAFMPMAQRKTPLEAFLLNFLTDDGVRSWFLQFETLQIAIDQAHAVAGIEPDEWSKCRIEVVHDDLIPWELVNEHEC